MIRPYCSGVTASRRACHQASSVRGRILDFDRNACCFRQNAKIVDQRGQRRFRLGPRGRWLERLCSPRRRQRELQAVEREKPYCVRETS